MLKHEATRYFRNFFSNESIVSSHASQVHGLPKLPDEAREAISTPVLKEKVQRAMNMKSFKALSLDGFQPFFLSIIGLWLGRISRIW